MKTYLIKSEDFLDVVVVAPNMGYAVRVWLFITGYTAKIDQIIKLEFMF